MPETLKGHSTKICEKLAEKYCAKCAAIGSTDCFDHEDPEEYSLLGKRRGDDIADFFSSKSKLWNKQQQEPPKGVVKPVAVRTNASGSGVPGLATPRNNDDKREEQPPVENSKIVESPKKTGLKEGGVRYRTKLGKWVVEYRPSRFKWKLWMGTYMTVEEGRRACDCARFYAGQEKGGFYFKESPSLFEQQGPLSRPFCNVSKDMRDKLFNQELKRRAKQIIKRDNEAKAASLGGGGKGGSNTNEARRRMKPGVKRADNINNNININININVEKASNPLGPATTTTTTIPAKEIINMDTTSSVNPKPISPNLGFDSPSTPRPADGPFPNLGFDSPSTSSQGSLFSNGLLQEEGDSSEPLVGGAPPHSSLANGIIPESDVFQDLPPLQEQHPNLSQIDWSYPIYVLGMTTNYNADTYLAGAMSIRSSLDAFDDCDDDVQLWNYDR